MSENESATRAKFHLPSVLLTLLSIVQALALELVWQFVTEREGLGVWGFENLVTWIQIVSTFLGILLIWLMYSGLVMRLRWVPSTPDSVMPFLIGLVEFALAGSLGAEHLGRWFLMLGLAYGIVAYVLQTTMRRARLDGDNEEFFATQPPAETRDFVAPGSVVLVFFFSAVLLWAEDPLPTWSLGPLACAAGLLVFQLGLVDKFWRRSMAAPRID